MISAIKMPETVDSCEMFTCLNPGLYFALFSDLEYTCTFFNQFHHQVFDEIHNFEQKIISGANFDGKKQFILNAV